MAAERNEVKLQDDELAGGSKDEQVAEGKETLHYDAFISYRHSDLDKFVAENLHKMLEAYRMPAEVLKKRKGMKSKIERVFRDKEELPLASNLNDPIMEALHNSDWLIVICSPRLRESVWCKKEIETFIGLNGREKVLAVLIEGEPEESFPEELLFRKEIVTQPDGSTEEITIPVEPLAADVRGKNKKEILKNMKAELLRILAAMFHMNYDDLRQRHKEQEHKRKMRYMTLGAAVCFLVSLVSIGIALQMNYKNKMIQGLSDHIHIQNTFMKEEQARSMADKALQYLEEGDRESAIQYAVWASTEYDSLTMPYTEEAQYALAESLGIYDTGEIYKAKYQFETMGVITHMDVAQDRNTLLLLDDSGTVTLYDVKAREVILELYADEHYISAKEGYAFLPNGCFAYWNGSNQVAVFNMATRSVQKELKDVTVCGMIADETGRYFAVEDYANQYTVYDGATLECIGRTPDLGDNAGEAWIDSEGILTYAYPYNSNRNHRIHFIDCKTMLELSSMELENVWIEHIATEGNMAYMLATRYSSELRTNICLVYGIDTVTGQIIWENSQIGCVGESITLPACEIKEELLLLTEHNATLIDMKTGETTYEKILNSKPVAAFKTLESNTFEYFCADGTVMLLTAGINNDFPMTTSFDCKTQNNLGYQLIESGVVVLPEQSNRITIYKAEQAEGVTVSDKKEIAQPVCYYDETAQTYAKEYGLEQADFVRTLFFDPDKQYVFASYWNNDFIIYDTDLEAIVCTLEDCDIMCGYWAMGNGQNMYLKGEKGGYILSYNYKMFMHIPYMTGLDLEQNKVYLQPYSTIYEAPIYTSVDLLRLAGPYMEGEISETQESEG